MKKLITIIISFFLLVGCAGVIGNTHSSNIVEVDQIPVVYLNIYPFCDTQEQIVDVLGAVMVGDVEGFNKLMYSGVCGIMDQDQANRAVFYSVGEPVFDIEHLIMVDPYTDPNNAYDIWTLKGNCTPLVPVGEYL